MINDKNIVVLLQQRKGIHNMSEAFCVAQQTSITHPSLLCNSNN